jgi:hypothetical protein
MGYGSKWRTEQQDADQQPYGFHGLKANTAKLFPIP